MYIYGICWYLYFRRGDVAAVKDILAIFYAFIDVATERQVETDPASLRNRGKSGKRAQRLVRAGTNGGNKTCVDLRVTCLEDTWKSVVKYCASGSPNRRNVPKKNNNSRPRFVFQFINSNKAVTLHNGKQKRKQKMRICLSRQIYRLKTKL